MAKTTAAKKTKATAKAAKPKKRKIRSFLIWGRRVVEGEVLFILDNERVYSEEELVRWLDGANESEARELTAANPYRSVVPFDRGGRRVLVTCDDPENVVPHTDDNLHKIADLAHFTKRSKTGDPSKDPKPSL